jgi:hypothetical protein
MKAVRCYGAGGPIEHFILEIGRQEVKCGGSVGLVENRTPPR